MASGTLRDLWERELEDLRSTEQKIVSTLPELISAATSAELKDALTRHLEQTKIHAERLDLICQESGLNPAGANRPSGIESVLRAGSDQVKATNASTELRDAAIIAAAQHVEHYEMAGYGCARTWARQLGLDRAADLLQETLDEEGDADKRLTDLAQSGINQNANAQGRAETRPELRSRLRYVDLDDLSSADSYRDVKVRNAAHDELGTPDGFLVDPTGRPYYIVIDSGGLFVGRRYVVPIGRADFRAADRVFVVDLDKDTLKRYPEFHRDAFLSMDDEEARRYEWRVLEAIDPQAARSSTRDWNYERYPYYREPAWFDRSVASSRTRPTGSSVGSSAARHVPVEQRPRDRVVAQEDIDVTQERPDGRERVRGRESDER